MPAAIGEDFVPETLPIGSDFEPELPEDKKRGFPVGLQAAKTGIYPTPDVGTASAFATTPEQIAAMNVPAVNFAPPVKINESDSAFVKVNKAGYNTVRNFLEGATTGSGMLGILIPPVGLVEMAASVPGLINKVQEAEKTPPWSAERFQAGTDVLGFMGLAGAGAKALEKGKAANIERRTLNTERRIAPEAPPIGVDFVPEVQPAAGATVAGASELTGWVDPAAIAAANAAIKPGDTIRWGIEPGKTLTGTVIRPMSDYVITRMADGVEVNVHRGLIDPPPAAALRAGVDPNAIAAANAEALPVPPTEAPATAIRQPISEGGEPTNAIPETGPILLQPEGTPIHGETGADLLRNQGIQAPSDAGQAPSAIEEPVAGAPVVGGRAPRADGGYSENPLVQFVMNDVGGILSKSAAKIKLGERFRPNQYDDAPSFPDPRHNKIYNPNTGQLPDTVAQAAADAGLLPPDADATTLWNALQGAADSSYSIAKQERAQAANIKIEGKQYRSFTAAISKAEPGERPINASDLHAARQAAANKAADEAHAAAVLQEQNQVPFGFGPGAAAIGENLRAASQIKQLTQTVGDALRTERPSPAASRVQRATNAVGGKFVSAREVLQRGTNTARATWLALKNAYLRPAKLGDFWDTVKDWQGADQRTSFEVRRFVQELRAQIKDPLTREAITNYIQADGEPALLQQRAAASNIKYRPGYEAALRLTDAQKTLAANVRQYFDGMLQDGINAGIVEHGLDNYINQVWKRPNKFTNELTADLQAGKLQTNFQFARKRIFGSFFDGEQANYAPATKDVSALVVAYDLSFNKALSARAFVKSLREAEVRGAPAVKFSGAVQPIPRGHEAPEAYLIRSRSIPEKAVTGDGRAYQIVDHPALRGWKFVVQDGTETPAYYQSDMLVHPDYAGKLRNILGRSWFRQNPVTSALLKAGAIAKQTKLSLSIFHLDQEGLHGLFHRVNPANLTQINFDDPAQWLLVRNGLQVADYQAMELFAEGLRGGGLVSKIPILGELQNRFNEFLFKDYIPRLKMTMALHAFERNVKRYPQLSPDVIADLTARQGNAAFGELNHKLMARNPSFQDFLRLTILAPDFLEARSRFVGQALKPFGREQQVALMLGAATMYVTARAMNQWLDNDPHWGKPFSVVYNGREYRLRTVMGDVWEALPFLGDPRRFFYNRLSPWLKQGVTVATGRDYRGIKLNNWEQVKDALSWFLPIPVGTFEGRGLAGDVRAAAGGRLQPVVNRVLGSAGVSNKPAETPADQVYQSALKFKEGLTDPKIQAEIKRARQETYAGADYTPLSRALTDGDKERAVEELVDLMKSKGKSPADILKYYSNLPLRPFTGSRALETQFLQTMSPVERARYRSAVNQRINLARSMFPLLPLAIRQSKRH